MAVAIIRKFEDSGGELAPEIRAQLVFAFSRDKVRFCRGSDGAKRQMVGVQLLGQW